MDAGYPRVDRFHLRDMRHEIEHLLWHILAEYDVVLLTGGVSKGKFDFLPRVLDQLSVGRLFQGVAQRPGKPFWFGLSTRRMPVFALPGNPASSFICLHRYVLPALARMSGRQPAVARLVVLAAPATPLAEATRFLPVGLAQGARGELAATPVPAEHLRRLRRAGEDRRIRRTPAGVGGVARRGGGAVLAVGLRGPARLSGSAM